MASAKPLPSSSSRPQLSPPKTSLPGAWIGGRFIEVFAATVNLACHDSVFTNSISLSDLQGKIYDLGGHVIVANSAPLLYLTWQERRVRKFEEMDSHKLALIDFQTGKYKDREVADDFVSVITLTLKIQNEANKSGHIGVSALSEIA